MWQRLSRLHLELILLLLLFAAAGLLILPLPFTRDQGIYAYAGWTWINDAIPYRDTFGHKGPLLYAIYAFFLPLSNGAMWGINLADLLARVSAVIATYMAVLIVNDRRAARLAALFVALPLAAVFTSCWWNAQAETFMIPLLALSVGLSATKRFPRTARVMAGAIAAQAIMLKSTAFIHAFFLIIYLMVKPRRSGSVSSRWEALFLIAGLAGGLIPWLLYFYANDAVGDMWESVVVFNTLHAGMQPGLDAWASASLALRGLWTVSGLLLVISVIPVIRWSRGRGDSGLGMAVGWFLSGLAQVIVQEKFFLYHWLVVIPPVGMLAAQGWVRGMGWFTGEKGAYRYVRWGLPSLLIVAVIAQGMIFARLYIGIQMHYRTVSYLRGDITRYEYYSRFSDEDYAGLGDFNFLASYITACYIRNHSQADDLALVFGYEPLVNYLSARRAPTRFHSDYPLTFQVTESRGREYRSKARWVFMNEINTSPPRYIVLVENDKNAIEPEDSLTQAREFTEFWNYIQEHYKETWAIQDFRVYEREALR